MAFFKITKSDDAPEGKLRTAGQGYSFSVDDDKPFETEDAQIAEAAQAYPEFYKVEVVEEGEPKTAADEVREVKALHRAQDKAEKQRAEKDPLEPAAPVPQTVTDLKGDSN